MFETKSSKINRLQMTIEKIIPFFGSHRGTKHNTDFGNLRCLLSRNDLPESTSCQNRYLFEQKRGILHGPKGRAQDHEFWIFSNTKMNVPNS